MQRDRVTGRQYRGLLSLSLAFHSIEHNILKTESLPTGSFQINVPSMKKEYQFFHYNYNCMKSESVSCSVTSNSLRSYGLQPAFVHEFLQTRVLEWVAIPFSRGIFPSQGLNPGLLYCRQSVYCLRHQESPQLHKNYTHKLF